MDMGCGDLRAKSLCPFTEIKRGFCLFYTTLLTKADKLRAFHPICPYWEIKLTGKQREI